MTLNYKYGIGDKVKLVMEPNFFSLASNHKNFDDVKDMVFEIIGWGWDKKETGLITTYYRLDINYGDNYLRSDNSIEEYCLEPVGDTHPFDEEPILKSYDGEVLDIGMKAYWCIYEGYGNKKPRTMFVFSGYGTIIALHKYIEMGKNLSTVDTKREFLCKREDGKDWLDARREGHISYGEPVTSIVVNVPETFAEEYVDAYIENKNTFLNKDDDDYFTVTSYLNHIGVLDKVVKLYNERKPIDNEEDKKKNRVDNNKLSNILGQLTPEEIETLKKLL